MQSATGYYAAATILAIASAAAFLVQPVHAHERDRAVGSLQARHQRLPAEPAARLAQNNPDQTAPRVTGVTPANGVRIGERLRTAIQARLSDEGTGVDPVSVRLTVDGLDVTANARITGQEVEYHERLGRGPHHAELVVKDRAGNMNRVGWAFRIV